MQEITGLLHFCIWGTENMSDPKIDAARARLEDLWASGKEFLGTDYAILAGAMSWVSERHLVSAVSNAGGFGVIACGSMTPDLLSAEIAATKEMTSKPFGVNLITMHPQLNELIEVCREHSVGHVVLAGGLPSSASIKQAKEFAKVICFAPALVLAKKLIRSGADALVIEGSEAGGHVGPVSLTVLAQEILPEVSDIPVFCAGGIGRGEAITGLLEQGRRVFRSVRVLFVPKNALPILISRRPLSVQVPATRSPRCSLMIASRLFRYVRLPTRVLMNSARPSVP